MVLGDWQPLLQQYGADTPILFCLRGEKPLFSDDYAEGLKAVPSHLWNGEAGWQPCILVELGQVF
ncbi:MAG: hypothetical protein IIW40_00230 [Clostridia bacterium]|nr:hypothetical protein [Clostridia bacterium]